MSDANTFPSWMNEWHEKLSGLINRANLLRAASGKVPHGVADANETLRDVIAENIGRASVK